MKSKLVVAVLALMFAGAARADSNTVLYDVSASVWSPGTCGPIPSYCSVPGSFQLQLTTEEVTGYFDVSYLGMTVYGTFPEITAMTGTFDNEYPVSYLAPSFGGTPTYDYLLSFNGFFPADIEFTADGSNFDIGYEGDAILVWGGNVSGEMLTWDIVDPPVNTPEPRTWALLGLGILACVIAFALRDHAREAIEWKRNHVNNPQ